MHRTLNAAPARQVLPQNTGLERAKTAWVELQRAWETVPWETKMRAYLSQPSRWLAEKSPPRQPNHRKALCADVSYGSSSGADGQNLQVSRQIFHRLLHLLLNPSIPGVLLPTVR
ncbi:hypothetical protein CHARACLAT_010720 [Characodon lateralis]|uniref:Uncharacterized protein n=1 Tax=Characodon lateralis TaxID=208331 RepID=A0ABU7CPL5_9TELE|nr:hypothetical protein [Characodon lateralis]